ncbi:MAG TPA: O-antigen ligase family protein, partial [Spongiibacteraceae bacterium]|nr:O-antigen ligase family protein [Spongiibacteraceae bacterium]
MITHGAVVGWFGEDATHIPMYCGLAIVLIIVIKRQWHGVATWLLAAFGALFTLMAIAALFAANQDMALAFLLQYYRSFIFALLIAGSIRHVDAMKTMSIYCLIGATIGGILALYQTISGNLIISTIYDKRAGGLSDDANDSALLMLGGIPFAIYWFYRAKSLGKIFSLGALALIGVGIILTGSRGGFVAMSVSLLIVYLRRPNILNTSLAILIIIGGFLFMPDYYKTRFSTLITGKEVNYATSLDLRGKLLQYGIKGLINHPLLGVGPGNFGAAYAEVENASGSSLNGSSPSKTHMSAHNLYLEFFVENGILTGGILLSIIASAVWGLTRITEVETRRSKVP